MDTRKLKYFLAVVDHGGFNRAAEHLLIAQPSLSQTIAGLEKELGVPLFHRIGRRAVLSDAGKELVGPARVVMRDLDAAQSAVQSLRGVRSGRLDIITMPSPGIEPLTSMISDFTLSYPSVRLNVSAAFTPEEVVESVRSGSTEIGLARSPGSCPPPSPAAPETARSSPWPAAPSCRGSAGRTCRWTGCTPWRTTRSWIRPAIRNCPPPCCAGSAGKSGRTSASTADGTREKARV